MLKIVLTGGPCSGKTQILSHLTQNLEDRGYKVFTVFEAATSLILNGIHPSEHLSLDEFQNFVFDMQLNNENLFERITQYYDPDKVIIFYDRGIMDGCAYVDKDTVFNKIIENRGLSISDIYSRYDAVLHLVTTADGAEEFYQWNDPTKEDAGNNAARSESPEEARIKDKRTLNSWIGHPHLRVFDNSTDFNGKINRVAEEVFALLGEPVPTEIERKFLIKMPTDKQIEVLGCTSKTNIIQTYLKKNDNATERRVRQRGDIKNGFTFYYTEKTSLSNGVRFENEQKITPKEYLQLLTEADTSLHQISKVRHCFVYDRK
jgi:predicted ATPase